MQTIEIAGMILLGFGSVAAKESLSIVAVDDVDLIRYCGTWYEIARLPNRFQRRCVGGTSAEYSMLPDGTIRVVNRCRKVDGSLAVAEGVARKEDPSGSNAKLKVCFAPPWLSWLPIVWGTYWIIDLAPDYSFAVVGEPSRKYLWILSRTRQIDSPVYHKIIGRLKAVGYQTERLVATDHS